MFYKKYIKRFLAILLSLLAIIGLLWLLLILAISIKLTSKGPVFFKQKRVGKNKSYFNILKFRTMRIDTPKDMPTHMLENPEQYITKVGRFLRKTSLDELPQLFNILVGQMAIVGPRPALWNQDDLIMERDRYHANEVRPGLTGLAQVSGRDELEIPAKAKLDGEYVNKISFGYDVKLIIRTVGSVLRHDGVQEGKVESKDEMHVQLACSINSDQMEYDSVENNHKDNMKKDYNHIEKKGSNLINNAQINEEEQAEQRSKRVLIIGAHSYIGKALQEYLKNKMQVHMASASNGEWENTDLSQYSTIIHLAAIVHRKEKPEMKELYQKVNCNLPVTIAKKAKLAGVSQFIFVSSAAVYGSYATKITKETIPNPDTMYGKTKYEAEKQLMELSDPKQFIVSIIRPPMVYGEGCKGNYPRLERLSGFMLFFPKIHNRRSTISVDTLCMEFDNMINNVSTNILLPQDKVYMDISILVKEMRKNKGKKTILVPGFTWLIRIMMKKISTVRKMFGDFYYDKES